MLLSPEELMDVLYEKPEKVSTFIERPHETGPQVPQNYPRHSTLNKD